MGREADTVAAVTQHPGTEHGANGESAATDALAGVTRVSPRTKSKEPYRTLAVVAVGTGLAAVPAIVLLGHGRVAIMWLVAEVLILTLVRFQRPDGTWIAARGRRFDVVFGLLLVAALLALSRYVDLPRVY